MQVILYALLAIVLVLILSRLMPVKGIRMISTEELKSELKNKNKQFIDVRTPGEYKANHISRHLSERDEKHERCQTAEEKRISFRHQCQRRHERLEIIIKGSE